MQITSRVYSTKYNIPFRRKVRKHAVKHLSLFFFHYSPFLSNQNKTLCYTDLSYKATLNLIVKNQTNNTL